VVFSSSFLAQMREAFMMKNAGKNLDCNNRTLEHQNEIMLKIVEAMQKPENPFLRLLTIIGTIVSISGIFNVIDTIIKWF
jgi:hypothetical protein